MTREEIKAEAKKYHTGWGDDRDNAPVQAFEIGAKWAYNRALDEALQLLNTRQTSAMNIDRLKKMKL